MERVGPAGGEDHVGHTAHPQILAVDGSRNWIGTDCRLDILACIRCDKTCSAGNENCQLACGKSQTAKLLFTLAKQSLALTGSKLRAFRRYNLASRFLHVAGGQKFLPFACTAAACWIFLLRSRYRCTLCRDTR